MRRTPATYDRILKHIEGHQITVHCTVTRQQVQRDGYIEEFVRTWSDNPNVSTIWMSLYTPQVGEASDERLTPDDRAPRGRRAARACAPRFPKLQMPAPLLERLPGSAGLAGRVHLRADHRLRVGGPRDAHHAVPVRRHAGLRELRLHGVGGPGGGRPSSPRRRDSDRHVVSWFVARRPHGQRAAAAPVDMTAAARLRASPGCCRSCCRRAAGETPFPASQKSGITLASSCALPSSPSPRAAR